MTISLHVYESLSLPRWVYNHPGGHKRVLVAYAATAAEAFALFRQADIGITVVLEGVREETPSEAKTWEEEALASRCGRQF